LIFENFLDDWITKWDFNISLTQEIIPKMEALQSELENIFETYKVENFELKDKLQIANYRIQELRKDGDLNQLKETKEKLEKELQSKNILINQLKDAKRSLEMTIKTLRKSKEKKNDLLNLQKLFDQREQKLLILEQRVAQYYDRAKKFDELKHLVNVAGIYFSTIKFILLRTFGQYH